MDFEVRKHKFSDIYIYRKNVDYGKRAQSIEGCKICTHQKDAGVKYSSCG